MKLYNALVKKNSSGKIEDFILLREGFSFSAFIFSGLWFLYHKMWREFLLLILINCAFVFLGKFLSNFDHILLEAAFAFMIALNANSWRCEHLKTKNYEFAGVIFAQNLSDAKIRFVKGFEKNCDENQNKNHAENVFDESFFALNSCH